MEKLDKKKKYQEVADFILSDIKSGLYKKGENIPTIRDLARQYNVNPQTVNKATSHLATLGYLEARQGSGSIVTEPEKVDSDEVFIPMLIDSFRSPLVDKPDSALNYHSKDIYLSYLMNMNQLGYKAKFYVYDQNKNEVNTAFQHDALKAHGVIVQGSMPDSYFSWLADRDIPAVLINRKPPEEFQGRFGSIVIDITNIGQMINYLISLNHKKIIFCQSDEYEENYVYFRRRDEAMKALMDWENEMDVEMKCFRFNSSSRDSLNEFKGLLEEGFSAAFCYNDVTALGLYGLVQKTEARIPYDFSIAGFDDIFASQLATPPLTTIRVNRTSIVSKALKMMDELMDKESPVHLEQTLPTELVFSQIHLQHNLG